jgi:GT2 family glycosyltransferase
VTGSTGVVIIAGGPSDALERCLASIAAQTYRVSELVLFGNGGDLSATAEAWSSRLPCPIVTGYSPVNLGVAVGRNEAAALCSSSLLFFIDDDATMDPDTLSVAIGEFDDPTVGAVAMHIVEPTSRETVLWYLGLDLKQLIARGEPFDVPWMIGCGQIIRRSTFDRLGGFWSGYFREEEEIDLGLRINDQGQRVRFVPGAIVAHPDRSKTHLSESISSNLCMSVRLIPFPTIAVRILIKLLAFARHAVVHRSPGDFLRGLRLAARRFPHALRGRKPLSSSTLALVRRSLQPLSAAKRMQW